MANTRAQQNRRIRQEALREQLQAQGHVQHVTDILNDLMEPGDEISALDLQRYKLILDTKLNLIKKYLPEEKYLEIAGDQDNPLKTITQIELTSLESTD